MEASRIIDLAPTILHLMRLPIPSNMDGNVLEQALTTAYIDAHPVRVVQVGEDHGDGEQPLSAEQAAEIEERLRALGYLG